ncbi:MULTISPECIES: hypothetical protein [unclassified Sinorhizobium]|uniref:hypothetical protein n=1 Tax=unclassified Sinorhizobium TaxID=2613772 RepID=UPI0024C24160|nr:MULTISPECIES: hypothetical protein [unclassified Sinorhizobium]MDK1376424.1 hypothetical protein [Sinorhizobium sp. 6-70]MDK1479973.1 hypothetical protein [Sinorhizobium sp. 6-117]
MRLVSEGKMRAILRRLRPDTLAKFMFTIWDRHEDLVPFISTADLEEITSRRFRARAAEFVEERIASIYVAGVYSLVGLEIPRDDWSRVEIPSGDFRGNRNNPVFWIGLKALEAHGMICLAHQEDLPAPVEATITNSARTTRIMADLKNWAKSVKPDVPITA